MTTPWPVRWKAVSGSALVNPIGIDALDARVRKKCARANRTSEEPAMKTTVACLLAAMFAFGSMSVIAADKKPTAEECKKDPKMAGCEKMKK
jgi:hypothetical protein